MTDKAAETTGTGQIYRQIMFKKCDLDFIYTVSLHVGCGCIFFKILVLKQQYCIKLWTK